MEENKEKKNKSSLDFGSKFTAMGQKNTPPKRPEQEGRIEAVQPVTTESKKKGRPKKGAVLDLNIGINVFLDKPLHKKLQFAKAETDIGIKDLIYMATDYVMNNLFDGGVPTREGERVIREFKEKMFGIEE